MLVKIFFRVIFFDFIILVLIFDFYLIDNMVFLNNLKFLIFFENIYLSN